ncbi:MAG: SDR family oxidoreductase [Gemmataceae bacterium]
MIPIDFSGKVALVTGVGDSDSFAWHISKSLQAAGAKLVWAVHPRMLTIVEGFLKGQAPEDVEARKLPYNAGTLTVEHILPCDVSYDSMADVPDEVRNDRRYLRVAEKFGDYTIEGMVKKVGETYGRIDALIHSVAFSPEITKLAWEVSRKAYMTALNISAYSLTGLCRAALPYMADKPESTSVVSLTYLAGERVVPHYGGGMGTAKAALQIDTKQLALNLGRRNVRVNTISAGPYASRAARAIGHIQQMIDYAAERSPLPRGIKPEEVGDACVYLCSPLASAVTGQVLYVDCGYNVMGV